MTIDFRAEVDKRKDALMEDLFGLLRINSERDDSKVDDKHPFGPGPVKALEHFLALAERDGYKTRNIDNYAGDFEFGQGDEVLGIFAHLDVVPAGSGWDTDPYEPVIKDGKLYARGSSDDKGPTMACYYALKIIKELELPVSKRVRFIVGTDEESGWGDMDYYFAHNGLKDPDFGFSPDAEFPIINGEKGNITAYLHFEGQNDGEFSLVSFNGGLRENMVPESASADFTGPITLKELESKLGDFVAEQEVTGQVTEEAGVFHVIIHVAKPGLFVTALFCFMTSWDEYMYASIFINTTLKKTIQVGMQDFVGQYSVDWGLLMSAVVISLIPILIFFALVQKNLVQGLSAGAVKG